MRGTSSSLVEVTSPRPRSLERLLKQTQQIVDNCSHSLDRSPSSWHWSWVFSASSPACVSASTPTSSSVFGSSQHHTWPGLLLVSCSTQLQPSPCLVRGALSPFGSGQTGTEWFVLGKSTAFAHLKIEFAEPERPFGEHQTFRLSF